MHNIYATYCRYQAAVYLPVRADRLKHVHPIVTGNGSVASRMGQVVTFRLRLQKSCLYARSRLKQCSPSRQLNISATKVATALRTIRSVSSISLPNTLHFLWWVLYMVMLLTEEWWGFLDAWWFLEERIMQIATTSWTGLNTVRYG